MPKLCFIDTRIKEIKFALKVREKPDAVNKTVAVFLWTYCIGFVAVYLSVPNPLVFQVNIYSSLLKAHHTNVSISLARLCTGQLCS